ncbi:MAG: FAD binding domain-containing protein [Acidimicrobiales bacterium]|jgi:carbon-monoxide dehydrogenase medium subunit
MNEIFKYRAPTSRAELYGLLADHGDGARVLAGGTDLLVDIRSGLVRPEMVINLKKVDDFSGLVWSQTEGLVIGPSVTVNEVLHDARVRDHYSLLAECALTIASHQLRNRATVVGNITHASPGADMAPGLLCLGARAVIGSQRGRREVELKDFFAGVKRTVLNPDEIVEAIVVPPATAGSLGSYRKLKRIDGHDLALVGVALTKKDGALKLSIASAAPTPLLIEGLGENAPADAVVAAAREVIRPISDLRCSKEYREYMIEVYIRRLLQEVR